MTQFQQAVRLRMAPRAHDLFESDSVCVYDSEIDEGLAQSNVYHNHGAPLRIQAEHDAL